MFLVYQICRRSILFVHFTSLAVTDNRDSSSILRFSTETLRTGQSSVNGGLRKLTEESINERQKPLIFKLLTKWISRFWKKINDWKRKRNGFFKGNFVFFSAYNYIFYVFWCLKVVFCVHIPKYWEKIAVPLNFDKTKIRGCRGMKESGFSSE